MFNTRALKDKKTREALAKIMQIYQEYDLAGGCTVINKDEMGFAYQLPTTWSALYDDPTLPMGLRIRAKTSDEGQALARRKLEATASTFVALSDFALQTFKWAQDFLTLLRDQGFNVEYLPFGGQSIPNIGGIPFDEFER
jgi:hypothetical protein